MFRRKNSTSDRLRQEQASEDRRRERRLRNRAMLRFIFLSGVTIDVILVLSLVVLLLIKAPYFNLQQVDVTGNARLSAEEVIEASEVEAGTNLLTVSLFDIAVRLKRHPWIRSASVYRRFPGQIVLEIDEREPKAIIAAEKLYYADENGEVFTRLLPGDSLDYPLFTGVTQEELGRRPRSVTHMVKRGLELIDYISKETTGLRTASVSEYNINPVNGLTLVLLSGRRIVVGTDDYAVKIKRLADLRKYLIRRGKWKSAHIIDLDFEDRALVRSRTAHRKG